MSTKNIFLRRRHSLHEFARFAIVGVVNTGVDMALFFLLTWLGISYVPAQVVSYSGGTANSYLLNKVWTFRSSGLSYSEVIRFIIINIASLALSVLCLALLHHRAGLNLASAKVAATACALAVNFLGSKFWVFKSTGTVCQMKG
jgi:putative flippase GtrA